MSKELIVKYDKIVKRIETEMHIESTLEPMERIKIKAIWDTGAESTMITHELAQKLKLSSVAITTINSISERNIITNIYMVNLYLPNGVKIESFVDESKPINCDILIGMDIISKGLFNIDNREGKTNFSFEYLL